MADVQLENGYTKIANKILERMALTKLSPIQYRLIFVIWRYTYGFNRKEHTFSLRFLSEATKYDQRQLQRELAKLEQRRIIIQKVQPGKPRIISFNKNYDEWLDEETLGNSTIGKVTNGKTTIGNSTKGTLGNSTEGTFGNPTNQEIKNINKNLKKNNDDDYIGDDNMTHDSGFQLIADKYIQRRGKGLSLSPKDEMAIEKLLQENIPLDSILKLIDKVFDEFEPKFDGDEIHSFEYVRKVVLSKYHEQKGGNTADGNEVHKHRRGVGRSAKEGKSYEQILREAEAARRAWGWKE
ncbi:replication protein [Saccharococcus caldoxylosilyticus]|uniref:Bacteriophage lambda Replication protein O N-terminal domain-containing protein n=1 Tax=Saccharococcus caldoxylosilyticus TaxID=81408 RepID=A0A150L7H6_9BACL|nr:replication protein [Parageobacillus caldoxylosilyticus]KYD07672.1 hypothetical protein B4119_3423 [Parageobacillus caldoxylosilyticus]